MEMEQILKRIDWLDDQHRKGKGTIAAMEERIIQLEGQLNTSNKQVQDLSSELTHLKTVVTRMDQFDTALAQARMELSRTIEDIEKRRLDREREIEEIRSVQIEGVTRHLMDLRKGLEPIPEMQTRIQSRVEEDYRLARLIDGLKQEVIEVRREDETWLRSIKLLEENHRRDDKRLTDLQGEALALRKRMDEQRGRVDLTSDSLRKLEVRLGELAQVESDRRETFNTLYEKQNLIQTDRDRKWKEWQARFDTVETQAADLQERIQSLVNAERDVKRVQESVESLIERVERRINEITEMQRLSEERFRQEWVTFKADDQKRWTNYTLTQEEQTRETTRGQGKLIDRLASVEDDLQEVKDVAQQLDEQVARKLQSLLALARDWVADYERVLGRVQA
jgi:chromosome segregation ATPase